MPGGEKLEMEIIFQKIARMNRASPVDLRKSLEIANHLAHIGIRFVPIPVATEEFQTLAAELSRRLEQMAVEAEKNEGGAA
jgi:hypothetical protein